MGLWFFQSNLVCWLVTVHWSLRLGSSCLTVTNRNFFFHIFLSYIIWYIEVRCPCSSVSSFQEAQKVYRPGEVFFFWLCFSACGILVPQPGIAATPSALEACGLNWWTTSKVPRFFLRNIFLILKGVQIISPSFSPPMIHCLSTTC